MLRVEAATYPSCSGFESDSDYMNVDATMLCHSRPYSLFLRRGVVQQLRRRCGLR